MNVGNVTGRVVTGLAQGRTYFYRVRACNATGVSGISRIEGVTTVPTSGLIINPTFDSSITGDPNATAIEAMIMLAISIYESSFSDSLTLPILLRYSTTAPNGDPLGPGVLAQTNYTIYTIPWSTFIDMLVADAKTSNDATANASLPGSSLSTSIVPSSAGGRAVGLNTPAALCSDETICGSGPFYDRIVTLNSSQPYQFARPPAGSNYDAQRSTEHEMDEVMALGSNVNNSSNFRPQDLFSWLAPGLRNFTSSGSRYFSINSGNTNIVGSNQTAGGDCGDWLSGSCPQSTPYVQNAFSCPGQFSDVTADSPEGINIDVVGYDLGTGTSPSEPRVDFNGDNESDILWQDTTTGQRAVWLLNGTTYSQSLYLSTVATEWQIATAQDFDHNGQTDIVWQDTKTGQRAFWLMNGTTYSQSLYLPTVATEWQIASGGDFNSDGQIDLLWQNTKTGKRAFWLMNGTTHPQSVYLPTVATEWQIVGSGEFNSDGQLDILWQDTKTGQRALWLLNGTTYSQSVYLPTVALEWQIAVH